MTLDRIARVDSALERENLTKDIISNDRVTMVYQTPLN